MVPKGNEFLWHLGLLKGQVLCASQRMLRVYICIPCMWMTGAWGQSLKQRYWGKDRYRLHYHCSKSRSPYPFLPRKSPLSIILASHGKYLGSSANKETHSLSQTYNPRSKC